MNHKIFFLLIFVFCASFQIPGKPEKTDDVKITSEELKLYELIMKYRKSNNLPEIPLSKSLTYVAQQHCKDLAFNKPDAVNGCNAHSWSDKGEWTSCCYTADHKQANCMWDKPRELTNYEDDGFEIAATSTATMTAEIALELWQESYHHNNVILNKDIWSEDVWSAIGIGIYNGYATVWFGKSTDKEGEPTR
ncbi:MAG: CAP domain-containing protein [Saprospiraceae bacterium]|nr:CAP domain-containing protein [Saprospiraceae bacterium]